MTGHRPYTFENRTDSCYRFDSPLSRSGTELDRTDKATELECRLGYGK
ncbi:unnamed protein product, partial [Fusarium fujikuroi]